MIAASSSRRSRCSSATGAAAPHDPAGVDVRPRAGAVVRGGDGGLDLGGREVG
jgi:hypothetical protein